MKVTEPITRLFRSGATILLLTGAIGFATAASAGAAGDELPIPVDGTIADPLDAPDLGPPSVNPGLPVPPPPPLPANGVENSLGMRFVPVGEIHFSAWLTRVKDFEVFASEETVASHAWKTPGFQQTPEHPVVNVTWNDAMAFCKWLTKRDRKEGLLMDTESYRLPTDEEWSIAVGLTSEKGETPEARDLSVTDAYPWGHQWPPPSRIGNYTGEETGADVTLAGYDDQYSWTSPVGVFPVNSLGLYDMGGNVWQWCMDSWNKDSGTKVLRGASWHKSALKLGLLSSCRIHARPDSSAEYYGFRVVRAKVVPDAGKRSARRKR